MYLVHSHHIPTDPFLVYDLCANVAMRAHMFRKIIFVCKKLKITPKPYKSHVMNRVAPRPAEHLGDNKGTHQAPRPSPGSCFCQPLFIALPLVLPTLLPAIPLPIVQLDICTHIPSRKVEGRPLKIFLRLQKYCLPGITW